MMTKPFNVALLRQRLRAWTGQTGRWPTDKDYARLPHTVRIPGLTPAALGAERFQRAFHAVRHAAQAASGSDFLMEAVRDEHTHERTGYVVRVTDADTEAEVQAAADAVLRDGR